MKPPIPAPASPPAKRESDGKDLLEARALEWVQQAGFGASQVAHLVGDLSARSYFRASCGQATKIVAHYPPDLRDSCRRFVTTTELLEEQDIRVPKLEAVDPAQDWMLVEDLGAKTLFDYGDRGWQWLSSYFDVACRVIDQIQRVPIAALVDLSPALDAHLLRRELGMTEQVFFRARAVHSTKNLEQRFSDLADALCTSLGATPLVPCHRDYMARNLIPRPNHKLAVIDHQDLRLGPKFYDLASLLNDSLFPPPTVAQPLIAARVQSEQDRMNFHRSVVQRTLKAIGSFASFTKRGNPRYEPLIPQMLALALEHLAHLPEAQKHLQPLTDAWALIAKS